MGGGGTLSTVQRGYRADAGIVFEPTSLAICPATRGGQAFKITLTGKGAHPIYSYKGVSALHKAIPLVTALQELERLRQEQWRCQLFDRYPIFLPIVIGRISADEVPSKVLEKCVLEGLMGYAPDETYQEARHTLEDWVATSASKDDWLRAHPPLVEWSGLNKEGSRLSPAHPFLRLMEGAFADVFGEEAHTVGWPAGCDHPFLNDYGQTPSLVFGPGSAAVAHSSDEYVEVEQLVSAAKVVAVAVLRWCGGRLLSPQGTGVGTERH